MAVKPVALQQPAGDTRLALIALILGGIAIGSSPIFVRFSEIGPISTAVWRMGLALIPFGIWMAAAKGRSESKNQSPNSLGDYARLAVPGVMLAADLAAWHIALFNTSVANATLLSNMAPIFVTLAAWLIFRAKISTRFLSGLVLAVGGVVVLKGGPAALSGDGHLFGDLLALIAAMFYAGYILSIGRLRQRFDTPVIMLWSTAVAALCLLPFALIYETNLVPHTLFGVAMLLGIALISHAGGQGLITYALAWLPAAFSSLTLLIQPVVAALLAWALLAEPVGMLQGIGGLIVLAGIFIARRG